MATGQLSPGRLEPPSFMSAANYKKSLSGRGTGTACNESPERRGAGKSGRRFHVPNQAPGTCRLGKPAL